jgi:hypothetical protein
VAAAAVVAKKAAVEAAAVAVAVVVAKKAAVEDAVDEQTVD